MTDKTMLQHLLGEQDRKSFEAENKILEPLLEEIALIEDLNIQHFVRSVLLRAGPFWDIPASFSGKHHPPDEAGPHGNVLHTKRVVRVASLICDAYGPALNTMIEYRVELVRDMVIAAAIIHDVTKGRVWAEGMDAKYDPMHPYTIDEFVKKEVKRKDVLAGDNESSALYLDPEIETMILGLVHSHMGKWSPIPETFPNNIPAMIVHLADNIAAHMHTLIDGEEVNEERWKLGNEH